ncbi:MAG TPA: DUF692 family protein, partial [Caulobacteraceae bacterium]|nr:DUF692 family protein [Caulobacteraceae bacterium]
MIRASGGGAEGRDFKVPPPRALEGVRVLGVGLSHLAALPDGFYAGGAADFVEITPETLAEASWRGGRLALLPDAERVKRTREACADLPMVAHGVELSIGSVCGMNLACLGLVEALEPLWPCLWYSEHLGFQTVAGPDGRPADIGVPLPLPNTREAARLVASRVREIVGRVKRPFLLENPAHFLAAL